MCFNCPPRVDTSHQNGFSQGTGRHGHGIYFWAIPSDRLIDSSCPEVMLAACFAQDRKYSYERDEDSAISVIIGKISVEQSEYLDLKALDVSKKFEKFILKYKEKLRKESHNKGNTLKIISKICDSFVRFIEKIENRQILVIHTETEIPKSYKEICEINQPYHFWIGFTRTNCYIVKRKELISVEKLMDIGDAYEYYQK